MPANQTAAAQRGSDHDAMINDLFRLLAWRLEFITASMRGGIKGDLRQSNLEHTERALKDCAALVRTIRAVKWHVG